MWVFVMILATILFYFLIAETTEKFLSDHIVIKLFEKRLAIGEIPFPAVTLCPEVIDLKKILNRSRVDDLLIGSQSKK
jgi:Amiloride-sensitive sodium channel